MYQYGHTYTSVCMRVYAYTHTSRSLCDIVRDFPDRFAKVQQEDLRIQAHNAGTSNVSMLRDEGYLWRIYVTTSSILNDFVMCNNCRNAHTMGNN
jgi:hypothetical protein